MDPRLWSAGLEELPVALSFYRWLAIAIIGFGIAVVVIIRDIEPKQEFVSQLTAAEQRVNRARGHVAIASERLRILQLVDSVKRSLGSDASPQSRVALSPHLDPRMQRGANQIVADLASERPARPVVPVDIAFVVDTVSTIRGVPRIGVGSSMALDHVMPRPNSNERCLVLARTKSLGVEPRNVARRFVNLVGVGVKQRFLGPCAYYERFGEPGAHIVTWLRGREWAPAVRSSWENPARHWGWGWTTEGISANELASAKAAMLRARMTPDGIACLAGDVASCERSILGTPTGQSAMHNRVTLWSSGIVSSGDIHVPYDNVWWDDRMSDLGPNDWTLLSEMVRTLGPERFLRFWRSDQPVASAFQAASGTSIGVWTRDWAQRMYGKQVRGPQLAGSSAATGAVFLALAVLLATFTATRRQVS